MLFTFLKIDSQHGYVIAPPTGKEDDIIHGKNFFDTIHNKLITAVKPMQIDHPMD